MKTKVPLPHDILRSPKWEWHIPDAPVADAVRSLDLKDGELVKRSSVRAVYRCGDYFLKFEFGTNFMTSLRNRLHPKARQEYGIGRTLAEAGIPAVECLGWGRLGGMNVLVTRALPGCVSVDEYYYTHIVCGGESPDMFVSEITAYLRKFFDAGFLHRDLHFGNILYNPDKHAFSLVDLIEISRPCRLTAADRKVMSRCVVTLRAGLNRAQMLHAIRAVGAADSDEAAEKYYFDEVRRTARHLKISSAAQAFASSASGIRIGEGYWKTKRSYPAGSPSLMSSGVRIGRDSQSFRSRIVFSRAPGQGTASVNFG